MYGSFVSLFAQGLLHGLGPDHLLAIGALATSGGGFRRAAGVSLRFGLGHTAVLALSALVATATGLMVPAQWETALEVIGGASLLILGCWTVLSRRGLVPHTHPPHGTHTHGACVDHTHEGVTLPSWASERFQTFIGALFGLSGVRALLLALPWMAHHDFVATIVGIVLFGLGVVLAMFTVGWLTQRAASATRIECGLRIPVGVASMFCGAWWVVDHL
jgi:hypothetical protein